MGNDIPETWSPLDETKLTKSQVKELPNYCDVSETKPASIAEAEKAAELKRKYEAGELREVSANKGKR